MATAEALTMERTMIDRLLGYSAALAAVLFAMGSTQPERAGAALAVVASTPVQGRAARGRVMLPARVLECHLARITNFDPEKEALPETYTYEGDHVFRLFLPAIPRRTTEPPRSTQRPEPVDPNTRILADPDGISVGAIGRGFDRVVDYWPERVELTTPVGHGAVNLIVLQKSEHQPGLTDIFMTKARDAISFDTKAMYSGHCRATIVTAPVALLGRAIGSPLSRLT